MQIGLTLKYIRSPCEARMLIAISGYDLRFVFMGCQAELLKQLM